MADNKFSFKDADYSKLSQGISEIGSSLQQIQSSKFRRQNIAETLEKTKLNFNQKLAERNYEVANALSGLKAAEARRGVTGTTVGAAKNIDEKVNRMDNADTLELLQTERSLRFADKIESVVQKNAKTAAWGSGLSSLIGFGSSGFGG